MSSIDIAEVLNTFDADVRTHMSRLLDEFGVGLSGNGEDLRRAFAEIAPFLRGAQRGQPHHGRAPATA